NFLRITQLGAPRPQLGQPGQALRRSLRACFGLLQLLHRGIAACNGRRVLALGLPAALSHQGIAFLNELVANDTKLVPTGCRSLQLTLDDLAEHLALTALEAILSTPRLPRGQDAALLQPQESQAMLPAASTTDQLKGAPMSVLTSCDDLIGR